MRSSGFFVGRVLFGFSLLLMFCFSGLFLVLAQDYRELYKEGEKKKVEGVKISVRQEDKFDHSKPVKFIATPENIKLESFTWSFGDGNTADGLRAHHVYEKPGTYKVIFKGLDAEGREYVESSSVVIYSNEAVTYYVSYDKGSDDNDGKAEDRPLKDLERAIFGLKRGDTLIILPGTYKIGGIRTWCKDRWKNQMYLGNPDAGDDSIRTTIKGKDGAPKPKLIGSIQFNGGHHITVENMVIEGGGLGYGDKMIYRNIEFHGPKTTYGLGGEHHNSLIENCYFHDIYGEADAIAIYITGHNNTIRNCFFKNIGHHAINSNVVKRGGKPSQSRGWVIENNRMTQCKGHGIGLQSVADFVIRNNEIVNVNSQAISFGGKLPNENVTITGNTIYCSPGTGYFGIFFINDMKGTVVENNIIYHRRPIEFKNPAQQLSREKLEGYRFRNNLYFNPEGQGIVFPGGRSVKDWQNYTSSDLGKMLDENSIEADPRFSSPPAKGQYLKYGGGDGIDLRPKAGSPALRKGVFAEDLTADISGKRRKKNAVDIGAHQESQ